MLANMVLVDLPWKLVVLRANGLYSSTDIIHRPYVRAEDYSVMFLKRHRRTDGQTEKHCVQY